MVLGLGLDWTVGEIREDMLQQAQQSLTASGAAMGAMPGGMSKHDYLDYEVRTSLVEGDQVDLIAMGRSEGPGCYCAVNHNLRQVVDSISLGYKFVVIDNEAGMEHLSRRTTNDVDHLLIISDPTLRGIVAAERIADLQQELKIQIENAYLILNRVAGETPAPLLKRIEEIDIPFLGVVPADDTLMAYEISGKPLVDLGDSSPVYQAVAQMMKTMLQTTS
jgi:CO dehydrogenase maturation factor